MSPFAVAVILILTALFALLSLAPFFSGSADMESFDPSTPKTKPAH
jgi:hypothetical protein